ncbi:zinc-ribbon domain containing protein [Candidatus Berkelbacteria bacterium]|nr:zinc-ribbon domain containing protein [Candidatus Berkelbacteria bacterium]MBI4029991.1 zinc-ribbon domain containing protein [Candidatus Berkelbacteria bacterium]
MAYQDTTLTCKECQNQFTWSAREQEFYAQKGFQAPLRCKDCREKRKGATYEITCANCGKKDTVNFAPRDPSSILCGECFAKKRMAEEQKP